MSNSFQFQLLVISGIFIMTFPMLSLTLILGKLTVRSYNRRPTQQEFSDLRRDAKGRLNSNLTLVSDWGRANLVLYNVSKTQFLGLFTRHNLPDKCPLIFNDTELSLPH